MSNINEIKRGQYFKQHRVLISSKTKISFNEIKTGMVLLITYHAQYRAKPKESIYLVIEPKFEGYLHTFDLDYIAPKAMHKILNLTKSGEPTFVEGKSHHTYTLFEFTTKERPLYKAMERLYPKAYRKLLRNTTTSVKKMEVVKYKSVALLPSRKTDNPDTHQENEAPPETQV